MTQMPRWCDHSPRARHPGMQSQVALGSIIMNKASGGDGISVELFQILKDDAVKVLHSTNQHIWKAHLCHRTGKVQFSFQSQRKAMPKNAQNTTQLHSSHSRKITLKILQARLQQYVKCELPDIQAGFTKRQRNQIRWLQVFYSL